MERDDTNETRSETQNETKGQEAEREKTESSFKDFPVGVEYIGAVSPCSSLIPFHEKIKETSPI